MDWNAIKTEYITTDTSYRKLADKYGVGFKLIASRGKAEKWGDLRIQYQDRTCTETLKKIRKREAQRATRLHSVADKMLTKIEKMVDSIEPECCDPKAIRALSAALKDLKEVQDIRSEYDRQEQRARIANLERTAGIAEPEIEDNSFVSAELFPDENKNS